MLLRMVHGVLVVEDEEDIAVPLMRTLEREGYEVSRVSGGAEAVAFVVDQSPAVVILDLGLPDMDGIDVCRQMRSGGYAGGIIMVTARAGSAMSAELGNMRVTEQIDAITTMGVSAVQYLLSPRLLASMLMLPLLCALYTSVGMGGSYLVAVLWLGGDQGIWMQSIRDLAVPKDLTMGLVKSVAFGFILSSISCRHGFFAKGGARGVALPLEIWR